MAYPNSLFSIRKPIRGIHRIIFTKEDPSPYHMNLDISGGKASVMGHDDM